MKCGSERGTAHSATRFISRCWMNQDGIFRRRATRCQPLPRSFAALSSGRRETCGWRWIGADRSYATSALRRYQYRRRMSPSRYKAWPPEHTPSVRLGMACGRRTFCWRRRSRRGARFASGLAKASGALRYPRKRSDSHNNDVFLSAGVLVPSNLRTGCKEGYTSKTRWYSCCASKCFINDLREPPNAV